MEFLHETDCESWCERHGARVEPPRRLHADPSLVERATIVFAWERSTGLEPKVAQACLDALGAWDSCLLWVTGWGVWPSGEDWATFYALRAEHGERRSVHSMPGHRFDDGEWETLRKFLEIVLPNGWDAHLLPARQGRIPLRIWISHDGLVDLRTAEPTTFSIEGA